MSENTNSSANIPHAATPAIKEGRSFSLVWLVPLVALLIGGWLAVKAITDKGPVITISFKNAQGIEARKTKVKFKDVEVGVVESITIKEDLSGVNLRVEMKKGAKPYLTENTKFWVVRARVSADEISGLGTLLGGVYIGIEPSRQGTPKDDFVGFEKPPIVTSEMEGKNFYLTSKRLGSLEPGSPIYYRQIKVGSVVDYVLSEQTGNVKIHIFVNSPYDTFVRENTAFWFASGLDVQLTADGLRVDTESMVSLLIGGITFSTLTDKSVKPEAEDNSLFTLYRNIEDAREDQYIIQKYFYIEFDDSVRGLSIGAPVEFRGLRVGSVEDIELKADYDRLDFTPMVRVSFEGQRLALENVDRERLGKQVGRMVEKGLRAQLKTGNLLTGQLFVDLEYFNDVPEASITTYKDLDVLPSIPSASQQITQNLASITAKLGRLPLDEIGKDLQSSLAGIDNLANNSSLQAAPESLDRILGELETLMKGLNSETVPEFDKTLLKLENLLEEMENWLSPDAPLYTELNSALENISKAAQAIADMANLIERQPESLLQGKKFEEAK